jgi:hypothetical protein
MGWPLRPPLLEGRATTGRLRETAGAQPSASSLMQQESCVPDRLMLAYLLIALMVIAIAVTVWHLTKGRRANGRNRRARDRAKQKATN